MARLMNLLLDTQAVLWWRTRDPRLGSEAREAIGAAELVFVSAVSAWEVAIKASLGKLRLPEPFASGVEDSGFLQLPVTFDHAAAVAALPLRHRDPFNRLLVAQARREKLALVTSDRRMGEYDVPIVWASGGSGLHEDAPQFRRG